MDESPEKAVLLGLVPYHILELIRRSGNRPLKFVGVAAEECP